MKKILLLNFLAKMGRLCNPHHAESISDYFDDYELSNLLTRLSEEGHIEQIHYQGGYAATRITEKGRIHLITNISA